MANILSKLRKIWETALSIWDESFIRSEGEPKGIRKFLHFWVLVWRSFVRNRCPVRASALSFTTLLSLVPILAVVMSISSAWLKKTGEEQIREFIEQFVHRLLPQFDVPSTNHFSVSQNFSWPLEETNSTSDPSTSEDVPLEPSTNTVLSAARAALASSATDETESAEEAAEEAPPIQDERVQLGQQRAAEQIYNFIQRTNSGALGVTGMFFLIVTVVLTLTRIEEAFNDIWGVTRGRGWQARITNYITTIVLGPALLMLALTFANGPKIQKVRDILAAMPFVEFLISTAAPVVVICCVFSLFYWVMPNTRVNFSAAFVGGSLAGVLWHSYNQLGFLFASRFVKADAMYGGLAIIPLFMGGLYIVWITVLFGAQVAYAFQNRQAYLQEKLVEHVNQRGREFVALRLMTSVGYRFQKGQPPASIPEMSKELGIPSRLIQQVLEVLMNARLVMEVNRGEPAFLPARPLEDITAHHILMAMRATQGQELLTHDEPVRAEVYGEFARIQAAEKEAASQISMLTLVNRAHARLELAAPKSPEETPKLTAALVPPTPTPVQPAVEADSKSIDEAEPIIPAEEEKPAAVAEEPEESEPESAPQDSSSSQKRVTPSNNEEEERNFPL